MYLRTWRQDYFKLQVFKYRSSLAIVMVLASGRDFQLLCDPRRFVEILAVVTSVNLPA